MNHVLVARPDRLGDVLVCGPAVRAVAAHADQVTMLVSPVGADAARLLPGVDDVLVWDCPWIGAPPAAVDRVDIDAVVDRLAAMGVDEALILTSFHQSALPTALLLRLAGIARIAAVSTDYPGDLLTARLADPPDEPEPVRMLAIAEAAGYLMPAGDDGRLAVRVPDDAAPARPDEPFVVVHPGVDAPARAYPTGHWQDVVADLTAAGRTVVVTGTAAEQDLGRALVGAARAPGRALDLTGRTGLAALATVLAGAEVVVVANTGPAHLAAAVGTPIVSLFAPVVPAARWAPYGVPTVLLGDQQAPCRESRARVCPVPGHPCLSGVPAGAVVAAVDALAPSLAGAP
jgi:ADP-heptose:LPS heptosyltransferase